MFLELIATIFAGAAAAGVMMLVQRASGGRLPKWLTPVAAGAAMLLATITSEYGWYSRTSSPLPEDFAIVETVESKALYRPWTYLRPFIHRFAAVDTASIQRHPKAPEMRLADIYYFGRWSPVNRLSVLVDCAGNKRAPITEGVTLNDDGTASGAAWSRVESSDPIISTVCEVA